MNVSAHPSLKRQDIHIFSTHPISFAVAALGGDIRIPTVDGDVIYNVKPGTKTDTKCDALKEKEFRLFVIHRQEEIIM